MTLSTSESSAEIAKKIKSLLNESPDDRTDAARLDELRKVYARLIQNGEFVLFHKSDTNGNEISAVTKKWNEFLSRNHKRFLAQLCERISLGKRTAVRTLWGVVATSPAKSSNGKYELVSAELLLQWVRAMSKLPAEYVDKSIRHMVQVEFFQPYRDVQYYSMIAIMQCAHELYNQQQQQKKKQTSTDESSEKSTCGMEERAERLLELLMMIPIPSSQKELESSGSALFPPPEGVVPDNESDRDESSDGKDDDDEDDDDDDSSREMSDEDERPPKRTKLETRSRDQLFSFEQIRRHHRAWAKSWLAVLRLSLPLPALKNALRFLPDSVLPHVPDPLRFADFFMQAYDNNGVVPLLALDGLFLLVMDHGLEYPNFYKQLYRLVTPSVFYVKYRTRFFRLLDKCLSKNEMLPAHVVAAFVKRLVRSTLSAPPSSILFVLALCSNLFRKHPEISCLVHRTTSSNDTSNNKSVMKDMFDAATDDPEQANALQSSLWEVGALERHYYPAVVTMAKSLGRETELVTPLYDLEDFVVQTYQSLFEQEKKRRQRNGKTPLTFTKPESLFVESDIFAGILEIP